MIITPELGRFEIVLEEWVKVCELECFKWFIEEGEADENEDNEEGAGEDEEVWWFEWWSVCWFIEWDVCREEGFSSLVLHMFSESERFWQLCNVLLLEVSLILSPFKLDKTETFLEDCAFEEQSEVDKVRFSLGLIDDGQLVDSLCECMKK